MKSKNMKEWKNVAGLHPVEKFYWHDKKSNDYTPV